MTKREGADAPPSAKQTRFDPVPGVVVAEKYRVDEVIGEGGMGIVVAATHLGLDQPVAIKFLLPEALRSRVAVERFLREARVAAKVRSDYVARVHDVGTLDGGVPYIVMEHLVGSDLGQLIVQGGALPIDEACEIVLQACEALAEVHAAGIVHRDLKPSNLFVTRRADGAPAVKLLDFGISKLTLGAEDAGTDPALTATATIMGSPSYMSPEQLKSTKEVDPRADVWSLGAVLYEALTGKPAFRAETVPQVCAMIASDDPVPPSTIRGGLPPELEHVVLGCLAKDADKRTPLVDLAYTLAAYAPERARPCVERIQAVLGTTPRPSVDENASTRVALPMAGAAGRTTIESRRGRGRALFILVAGILAVGGFAHYATRANVQRLGGDLAGAEKVVASAASAVASAAATVIPSVPIPALPLPEPESSASAPAGEGEPNEETSDDESPVAGHDAGRSPGQHAYPNKAHPPKPKHMTKTFHRRHT